MTLLLDAIIQAEANHAAHKQDFNLNLKKVKADENILQLDESYRVSQRIERLTKGGYVGLGLERVIGPNDLLNINYLEAGLHAAKSVCKIATRDRLGHIVNCGTGFLISPNLVITNHHVIESPGKAASSEAIFEYEYDRHGKLKKSVTFRLKPDRFFITSKIDELDYSIIAVEPHSATGESLTRYGFIPLIEDIGKIIVGEHVTIIQHPNGEPKQIAVRNNQLIYLDERYLHYETDTAPGSSGALVVNNQWEAVALHHSGVPRRKNGKIVTREGNVWSPSMGEHQIDWIANEGIRISRIISDVRNRIGLTPDQQQLRDELLDAKADLAPVSPTRYPATIETGPAENDVDNVAPVSGLNKVKIEINILAGRELVDVQVNGGPQGGDALVHPHGPSSDLPAPAVNQEIRFEILLTRNQALKVTAIHEIELKFHTRLYPVFRPDPGLQQSELADLYEAVILTNGANVWDMARELNAVEGVADVDPDLPTAGIEPPEDEDFNQFESGGGDTNKEAIEAKYKGITTYWNQANTFFGKAVEYVKKQESWEKHPPVRIAQIDTGYTDHPEIKVVNRKKSYNFMDPRRDGRDELKDGFMKHPGHGTRTGSVIIGGDTTLAHDDNNGVFPHVDLVPFRVANSVIILGTADNVSQAVMKAIEDDFEIITMSMGSYGRNSWRALAEYAYNKGVFWVCAAGNEVRKFLLVVRPAQYPGTIAVAATNYQDKPWSRSSRGKAVDVSAPGEHVYVPTILDEKKYSYSYGSGTSYATPHVAAAAALWLNHHRNSIEQLYQEPWQRVEAFRYILKKTARKPDSKWPDGMGAGILNTLDLIKHDLPAPGELVHAYSNAPLEGRQERALSITEKELVHMAWNRDGLTLNEGLQTGLSEKAAQLLEVLRSERSSLPSGLESGGSQDALMAYVHDILQSSTI